MIDDKNYKSINLAIKLNFKQEKQLKSTSLATMTIFSKLKVNIYRNGRMKNGERYYI